MTLDPTQLVTLALAALGAFGTGAKVVEKVAPKWIEWRKRRDKNEAEQAKAEREETGQHIAARFDCERRCAALEAKLAALETRHDLEIAALMERLVETEQKRGEDVERLTRELSKAMQKIDRQAEEIDQLRKRNTELTRELRDAYARLESQPPLTRIG